MSSQTARRRRGRQKRKPAQPVPLPSEPEPTLSKPISAESAEEQTASPREMQSVPISSKQKSTLAEILRGPSQPTKPVAVVDTVQQSSVPGARPPEPTQQTALASLKADRSFNEEQKKDLEGIYLMVEKLQQQLENQKQQLENQQRLLDKKADIADTNAALDRKVDLTEHNKLKREVEDLRRYVMRIIRRDAAKQMDQLLASFLIPESDPKWTDRYQNKTLLKSWSGIDSSQMEKFNKFLFQRGGRERWEEYNKQRKSRKTNITSPYVYLPGLVDEIRRVIKEGDFAAHPLQIPSEMLKDEVLINSALNSLPILTIYARSFLKQEGMLVK